jgi:hypothetical protein
MKFDGWADSLPLTEAFPFSIEFAFLPEKGRHWEFALMEDGMGMLKASLCGGDIEGVFQCPEGHYHLGILPKNGGRLMLYTMEIEQ